MTMAFRSNQDALCEAISPVAALGLRATSMGEPISTSEAGRAGSSSSAIIAAAASAGTPAWLTASSAGRSRVTSPSASLAIIRQKAISVSVQSSMSKAPAATGTLRASRQSVM